MSQWHPGSLALAAAGSRKHSGTAHRRRNEKTGAREIPCTGFRAKFKLVLLSGRFSCSVGFAESARRTTRDQRLTVRLEARQTLPSQQHQKMNRPGLVIGKTCRRLDVGGEHSLPGRGKRRGFPSTRLTVPERLTAAGRPARCALETPVGCRANPQASSVRHPGTHR